MDIAEHSMCQPGRPGPHGSGQEGSPGFAAFHRAKSSAIALALVHVHARAGESSSSRFLPESLPYRGKRRTSK